VFWYIGLAVLVVIGLMAARDIHRRGQPYKKFWQSTTKQRIFKARMKNEKK